MGLISQILTVYKADTSDHKAKIKELAGEQKKAAEAELKHTEAANKSFDGKIKAIEKYAVTVAAVAAGLKIAFDLAEFSGRKADISAAAGNVSIDRLRTATLGLRSDMELLEVAAKLNHSAFKLTQGQMDIAAKAMTALGERGGDAQQAIDAVTDAMVSGGTKGLKEYGIEIDETKDKTTKLNEIMGALAGVSGEVSDASLDASDKISQSKVKFQNMFDTVRDGLGNIVMALEPLITALIEVVGLVFKIANPNIGAGIEGFDKLMLQARADSDAASLPGLLAQASGPRADGFDAGSARGYAAGSALNAGAKLVRKTDGQRIAALSDDAMTRIGEMYSTIVAVAGSASRIAGVTDDPWATKGKGGKGGKETDAQRAARLRRMLGAQSVGAGESLGFSGGLGAAAGESDTSAAFGDVISKSEKMNADLEAMRSSAGSRYSAYQSGKTESKLAAMFGPIEDFNAYSAAFTMLSGAVSASLGAWIDGSMSAGQAFKKFIGEALKGLASQMLIESLKHAAYAIGSLAMYDYAGATLHTKAAFAFGAGAGLAALAAKEMGSSASSRGSGGGARPSAPSGGGGGGGGDQGTRIIVYADQFADDSPRGRQLQAKKLVGRALGNSAVERN